MTKRLTAEREADLWLQLASVGAFSVNDVRDILAELDAVRAERDAALTQVKAVLEWAIKAYHWEHFWVDRKWITESAFDRNGKKLRDFIEQMQRIVK